MKYSLATMTCYQKYMETTRLLYLMITITAPVQKIMNINKDLLVKYLLVTIHPDIVFRLTKEIFLANPENKKQFIAALKNILQNKGIPCIQAKDDADILIVKAALEKSVYQSVVNVVAEDIDVLVLLVHHCNTNYKAEFYFSCKTDSYNVKYICESLESCILDTLLFSYTWTGCDSVSYCLS